MDKKVENRKRAIIVLHEIYGVNNFIQTQCQKFRGLGYDVFCPNLIDRPPFSYEKSEEAYVFFRKNINFEVYKKVNESINKLKDTYDQVFIMGFSVGATIAWRCCENPLCSGIIACYGSRIRDYAGLTPACPVLLLFAREDSFDVHTLVCQIQDKPYLKILEFDAEHGFMDSYSKHFSFQQSKRAEESIARFIKRCTK